MKRIALLSLALLACEPEVASCRTHCGAFVEADNGSAVYSCLDYRDLELALADELSPTLPRACEQWRGFRLIELPGEYTITGWTRQPDGALTPHKVAGWTDCALGHLYFHTHDGKFTPATPDDLPRRPWNTALPHELIHGAQACASPLPIDPGMDIDHSDWIRNGFVDLPQRVADRLSTRLP